MKVLKLIEKILFVIGVIVAGTALSLSVVIDEANEYPGLVTASASILLFSSTTLFVLLLVGALLRYSKSEVASRIGDAFTIVVFSLLFGLFLAMSSSTVDQGITITLGFVSSIFYVISAILRFVASIFARAQKESDIKTDPDKDPKIQLVLKWKQLFEEKIISAEEFETKRKEILGIKETKAK